MTNKVYVLKSNLEIFPFFLEKFENIEDTFKRKHYKWKDYDKKTYHFELRKNNSTNKKNYNFDISKDSSNLIIFSDKAVNVLKDLLNKTGTFVDIKTDSKRKKFYGFYPNQNIYGIDIIDLKKSKYHQSEKGYLFDRIIFNDNAPVEEYLFTLEEYFSGAYVTDKFKKIVEDSGLVGFDFTEVVYEK